MAVEEETALIVSSPAGAGAKPVAKSRGRAGKHEDGHHLALYLLVLSLLATAAVLWTLRHAHGGASGHRPAQQQLQQRGKKRSASSSGEQLDIKRTPVNVSTEAVLDLIFQRHYTNKTELPLVAGGPNLHTAVAGQPSSFVIRNITLPEGTNHSIYVWFQGPAIFTPTKIVRDSPELGAATVNFMAVDPGEYKVHVEVMLGPGLLAGEASTKTESTAFLRATGSPFKLRVADPATGNHAPALNVPLTTCPDGQWRLGRWLPCQSWEQACMRTGWRWVPFDCQFELIDPQDLPRLAEPTWIVLAGTSVQRGTFWSLVDGLLQERAANLTRSSFWKCWGWMDLKMGNFRVSYLDFRCESMWLHKPRSDVEPDYMAHAALELNLLAHEPRGGGRSGRGPDLVYLEYPYPSLFTRQGPSSLNQLITIRSWLGESWQGRFVFHVTKPDVNINIGPTDEGKHVGMRIAGRELFDLLTTVELKGPQLGIEYIDEYHMALPFMHTMELPLEQGYHTPHYHKPCETRGMHSCSYVADMAAQMLLNVALRPGGRRRGGSVQSPLFNRTQAPAGRQPFEFCMRCPEKLLPFTIFPAMTGVACADWLPADRLQPAT